MKEHTMKSLISAIEEDEQWHFKRIGILNKVQWATMIPVAIAGAFTAFAGTPAAKATFMSYPESLLIVGIITAVCAIINQGVNFSARIARHRAAALSHRMVKEQLSFGKLTVAKALKLRAQVYGNPEIALEALSGSEKPGA